jgi:tartrate-resistant acid phosphatase type 5
MNDSFKKYLLLIVVLLITISTQTFSQVRFAAIGDYGLAGENELAVANLVKSWNPDFIITLGDNNYEVGSGSTIDANIGQYYHQFIFPYHGSYGDGSFENKFFPALGNHDLATNFAQPYFDYFELPGNERYYDFIQGNVHCFVINSDSSESDGIDENSIQANWLKNTMQSSSPQMWKVIYFHHPPYSSGPRGSIIYMQWPFREWGAHIVLSGHEHNYERLFVDSITYFINGLGGKSIYTFLEPIPESIIRYCDNYGAMLIESFQTELICKFINVDGVLIDSISISDKSLAPPITEYLLQQNYPNPFNTLTTINYQIPFQSNVTLKLYDILGREVSILVNEQKPAGRYKVDFAENNLSSGVYFYTLRTDNFSQTNKMIMLK